MPLEPRASWFFPKCVVAQPVDWAYERTGELAVPIDFIQQLALAVSTETELPLTEPSHQHRTQGAPSRADNMDEEQKYFVHSFNAYLYLSSYGIKNAVSPHIHFRTEVSHRQYSRCECDIRIDRTTQGTKAWTSAFYITTPIIIISNLRKMYI